MKTIIILLFPVTLLASINVNNSNYIQNLFTRVNSISQDSNGYIWLASDNGVFKYNGYEFETINNCETLNNQHISQLITISTSVIIVLRKKLYLYSSKTNSCSKIELPNRLVVNKIYKGNERKIWVTTNSGLFTLSKDLTKMIEFSDVNFSKKNINSITLDNKKYIIYSNQGKISILDIKRQTIQTVKLPNDKVKIIHNLKVNNEVLFIATDINIFQFNLKSMTFTNLPLLSQNAKVTSILIKNNILWATTIGLGLIKLDLKSKQTIFFSKKGKNNKVIKEDTLVSLFLSRDNTLFIGGFYHGLSQLNLTSLKFNYSTIECIKGLPYYSSIIDKSSNIWIGSDNKLIQYNFILNKCTEFKLNQTEGFFAIYSMVLIKNNIWFSKNNKIYSINLDTKKIITISSYNQFIRGIVYDIHSDNIYSYSKTKLHIYNLKTKQDNSINLYLNEYKEITDLIVLKEKIILSTNKGLYQVNSNLKLSPISNNKLLMEHISTVSTFKNIIYIAIKEKGIYTLIEENLQPVFLFENSNIPKNISVDKIIKVKNKFWLSSNIGLINIDIKENNAHLYQFDDGLYNNYFYKNFSFLASNNEVYFGGKNGYIHFRPNETFINKIVPKIALEYLYIQDKKVAVNTTRPSGLVIDKFINDLNELNLSYKDYIVGLEFVALDYADPMRNQYAYRLKGFQKDWVYTSAKNRKATYTNLSPGDYVFQVKASNKDGVWSKTPKELKIIVHPAPWFSPFAYAAYMLLILFSIWSFIRYKTIASRKRALILEKTVDERTQEVKRQKKMVESLLQHKNEVFANITHEFKTPLALILGPVEQLTKQKKLIQHSGELTMIERNAKRLMLMVAQILKLSQAESDKEVIRESQSVQAILLMLFEAFSPLSKSKNINLVLNNTSDVSVYATTECLEIVVGNLLSNAIKYTNDGGEIFISSKLVNKQVAISIKDSGAGIEEKDLSKIFKRFTRLDTHKNIAGTGIGLSVVKEISEANDGFVKVESTWGKGSTFTVTFPITDIKPQEEMSEVLVDQLVKNTENELIMVKQIPKVNPNKNRVTVLVIEDNLDMQSHIASVLGHRFNCLFADRGRKGIAIALKELPDIIICDVMMPAMDGYQVTRILRHDGRTSHIPIVLLTALNTTKSRIKGWRENIDTYMTKPFNADELNAQIDNILIIRKNLQKQTNRAVRCNSALDSLNLSKQDEKFIDKFKDIIGKYYSNEYFQKADLASKMAISERQLQRKLKALIDQNPMEMLRDYRLEKAAMKLKDGYQVGIVSDECGFSSVSYFGSCFKKKYGITPKAYQTLNKK